MVSPSCVLGKQLDAVLGFEPQCDGDGPRLLALHAVNFRISVRVAVDCLERGNQRGYFAPVSGSTLAFYPLPPCRVADTRKSSYPQGLGPPFLTGGAERQFPILNATSCNIPSGAAAYSLNFSVVPHGSLFYMTVWPTGETRPTVSTLNDIPGQIIANAAIVTAGASSGEVSVYPTNDTDLVIDINGYFAAAGQGGLSLYGVTPCRVIDTRKLGSGLPFSGTLSPPVDAQGRRSSNRQWRSGRRTRMSPRWRSPAATTR